MTSCITSHVTTTSLPMSLYEALVMSCSFGRKIMHIHPNVWVVNSHSEHICLYDHNQPISMGWEILTLGIHCDICTSAGVACQVTSVDWMHKQVKCMCFIQCEPNLQLTAQFQPSLWLVQLLVMQGSAISLNLCAKTVCWEELLTCVQW